jgi:hypothetical protein
MYGVSGATPFLFCCWIPSMTPLLSRGLLLEIVWIHGFAQTISERSGGLYILVFPDHCIARSGRQISGSHAWRLRLIVSAHVDRSSLPFTMSSHPLQPLQPLSILSTSRVDPCLQTSDPKPSSDIASMSCSRRPMSPRALPGMGFRLRHPCSLGSYRV